MTDSSESSLLTAKKVIEVHTKEKIQLLDITNHIRQLLTESNIINGLCHLYIPHTTAGIIINENADPSVVNDILIKLNELVPLVDRYQHLEGNAAAHIKSTLVGIYQTIMIEEGRLLLGTWQGVFFCEFDGPRKRQVWVKYVSC